MNLAGFYNLRASEEVCPKHRNSRRETAGWYRKIARGVCSLLKWQRPGAQRRSGPVNCRGCDLTAEWLPATEHVRVQLPAAAQFISEGIFDSNCPACQNPL